MIVLTAPTTPSLLMYAPPPILSSSFTEERHIPAPLIIVVDDDVSIRDVIAQTLDDEGYTVYPFSDGEQALAFVRATPPALILLDLMMPIISGKQVIERLRADPATANIPVVLISASHNLEGIRKQLNADACLSKPFDLSKLVDLAYSLAGKPDSAEF